MRSCSVCHLTIPLNDLKTTNDGSYDDGGSSDVVYFALPPCFVWRMHFRLYADVCIWEAQHEIKELLQDPEEYIFRETLNRE